MAVAALAATPGRTGAQTHELSRTPLTAARDGLTVHSGRDTLEMQAIERNVVRVHFEPNGRRTARTLVVDPHAHWPGAPVRVRTARGRTVIATGAMIVKIAKHPLRLEFDDAAGKRLLWDAVGGGVGAASVQMRYTPAGSFYGIDNTSLPGDNVDPRQDIRNGVLRNAGGIVSAGLQGDGGAPLVFNSRCGLLVDSDGGRFDIDGDSLRFHDGSRPDTEFFVIIGDPETIMSAVADISGHPPMMPKWSLGFLNSQWGSSQDEIKRIVRTYRAKQIPLDAFILDFDWKAWGEDDYGEWRWNSTHGPGNVHPDLFPDGASGRFARNMAALGVKLAGIWKPRILLRSAAGSTDAAAAYALAHRLFFAREKPYRDYFSGRFARDLDFSIPLTRTWYWQHMLPAYRAGIVGFWNDEADAVGDPSGSGFVRFPNFQHLDMERAMYDGARAAGDQRVWSISRNFYLGAQRYAYGEWSGDIETSFDSMREQAIRMLGAVDVGEAHWSMDTGGFDGHPSPENYARWMEMAAFVPIMRVHGTFAEKRQPWVYGAQAEADAKRAIALRYRLLPYSYAYERQAHESGLGVVRPLFWEFPSDRDVPYVTDEWMFGHWLLVAPVFGEGQAHRSIYLPTGTWYDYFRGTRYSGARTITYPVDAITWRDVPLFVRAGAIVPTQPVEQYVGQHPARRITLDVFANAAPSAFALYDDDGLSYAYERGAYFAQTLHAQRHGRSVEFWTDASSGAFEPPVRTFEVRLHGIAAHAVTIAAVGARRMRDAATPQSKERPGWSVGTDAFGPVTTVALPAGVAGRVVATE